MEIGIGLFAGLIAGLVLGYLIVQSVLKTKHQAKIQGINAESDKLIAQARQSADRIIKEADTKAKEIQKRAATKNEQIKQQKIKEAKEKFRLLKANFETEKSAHRLELKERALEVVNQEKSIKEKQARLHSRQEELVQKEAEINNIRENLEKQLKIVNKRKDELQKASQVHIQALEQVSKLSQTEAKEQLLETIRDKTENDALSLVKNRINRAKQDANKEAKKIIIQTIQRMCAEYTIENTVSVFSIENDSIKGQIIGREGRNIRALEAATGAEIVVDDTPEAVVISSFDAIRREICRLSLKRLVADGRIHPARIEEVVAKVKKELNEQIIEIGERAIIDLDIHGLDPYLVRMVGRMRFRSSYGQNLLKHSMETANLCAVMAAELGLSPKQVKLAKRAGLLHDIGKVTEEESELSHAPLGMKMCQKHGENNIVCNAVGAHHDEIEMTNIISPIVQACDAISGARPGARREIMESYLKRIGELEELAMSYDGVQKAYALQAGRELRVIVESSKISDDYLDDLSFMISDKIEKEMQYPGQVKVTVIRENRAVSFAR